MLFKNYKNNIKGLYLNTNKANIAKLIKNNQYKYKGYYIENMHYED